MAIPDQRDSLVYAEAEDIVSALRKNGVAIYRSGEPAEADIQRIAIDATERFDRALSVKDGFRHVMHAVTDALQAFHRKVE